MLKNKSILIILIAITIFFSGVTVGTMAFSKTEYITEYMCVEPEPISEVKTEPALKSLGTFKLTAYCACSRCCGKCDGITATGVKATAGRTIAVDPSKIPYGTEVIINGHTYIAEDCGGAIKGNKIDIFFNSHAEALRFGIQYAEIFVK